MTQAATDPAKVKCIFERLRDWAITEIPYNGPIVEENRLDICADLPSWTDFFGDKIYLTDVLEELLEFAEEDFGFRFREDEWEAFFGFKHAVLFAEREHEFAPLVTFGRLAQFIASQRDSIPLRPAIVESQPTPYGVVDLRSA